MAAVGAVAAVLGGAAGMAAMSPYVTPPPPSGAEERTASNPDPGIVADLPVPGADGAVHAVGDRVGDPACKALNLGGHAQSVPVASQVSKVGVVVVDATGNLLGSGECTVSGRG